MDRDGCRRLDAEATERFGIPGIVLMENAARGVSDVALQMINPPHRVHMLCGPGNNGGDGWAAARHLHNAGCAVSITSIGAPREGTDAATNASIAEAMGIPVLAWDDVRGVDLVIDALFGTGLDRPVDGAVKALIDSINAADVRVLAVDLPSGLDANSGSPLGAAIRADATATLVAWKHGFLELESVRWTGEIHTVDIGVPRELVNAIGTPLERADRHGRADEGSHSN